MLATEFLDLTKRMADLYRKEAKDSLIRNCHMNQLRDNEAIDQRLTLSERKLKRNFVTTVDILQFAQIAKVKILLRNWNLKK